MDRRRELAEVKRLLSAGRLLTLTGAAGVGKTRLALRIAERLSRAFPDGVWLVSLSPLQDGAPVAHAVADALGISDDTGRQPLDLVVEYLRARRLLLVLDNCEHLLDACAALVGAVLPRAAGVRILATSRHRLNLTGEHLLEVPPLGIPAPEEPVEGVSGTKTFPALELFSDRATAVVPDFAMTAGNLEYVARLCRRLDGLPLAIELAAVRLRTVGIKKLVEQLDDRFRLLTGGGRSVPPRHQTLRAAIEWSYGLCTQEEQRVWALLSVFAGSFDLDAAEAVCTEDDGEHTDVLDVVAGLVDKSILIGRRSGDAMRYQLLSSLRDYGLEKLAELGTVLAARRRHRDHYLRLAEACERQWFGPRQLEIAGSLRSELDNFRAVLNFCTTTPSEVQIGLRLAAILWCHWTPCGANDEMRYWFQQAVHRGAKPSGRWATGFWVCGMVMVIHGRSTQVLQAAAPPDGSARARDDRPAATPVAGWRPGERELMSFVVLSQIELACTLVFHARPDQAVPLCREALAVCQAYDEQWARSYALRTLALAQWALGEYDGATEHARECLRLEYVVHDQPSLGRTLELLAAIAADKGDAERATVLQGATERIRHDTGQRPLASRPRQAGRIRASERRTRETLGDRGFEQAFKRGEELSRNDVVTYALQERSKISGKSPKPSPASPGEAADTRLTPRERQVAELVSQGLTDKQISAALVIAQRTAEWHVRRILTKLRFTNRTQLAAWFSSTRPPGERPESR
ncbi:LuxR C-terminal-related transcriptional regulator [Amycolatopsis sp. EV170708-02-1]|uniref:helix-turn-helix transcriptional regulator n=1 Tax=Amycolatopsis sp. EV170708-02-1 TaxID=2919322 RepID=UPI001F0B9E9F|nr:LuxR C-terminal-related transcriptional regulator [Amycolatopsis sp. EV170708-02-1]UMP06783.1 LuxR C-terminal-related transcriptional regulator [Amycolatopsis sp. EV170708-02-1]